MHRLATPTLLLQNSRQELRPVLESSHESNLNGRGAWIVADNRLRVQLRAATVRSLPAARGRGCLPQPHSSQMGGDPNGRGSTRPRIEERGRDADQPQDAAAGFHD
jgi:hypothetical protein